MNSFLMCSNTTHKAPTKYSMPAKYIHVQPETTGCGDNASPIVNCDFLVDNVGLGGFVYRAHTSVLTKFTTGGQTLLAST